MRGRWSVVLAFAVSGCNWVFGIDETAPLPATPTDRDGDQVPDLDDNCPDAANSDQADADEDGFGDACDRCPTPTATNHDEDGDGRGDDCDACPGIVDNGQDGDGDGVGDRCEQNTGLTVLVAFDPFVALSADWQSSGDGWSAESDSISPANLPDPGLHNQQVTVSGRWFMDIGVHSSSPWSSPDRFGVGLADGAGNRIAGCELLCKTECNLIVSAGAMSNTGAASTGASRLRLFVTGQNDDVLYCSLDTGATALVTTTGPISGAPMVFGSPRIAIDYVAAWADGLLVNR